MASTASSSVGHITSHAWAHHICVLFVVSSSTMHHCARDYAQVERADEQWRRSLHRYGAHYLSLSPLRLAIYTICILLRATCVTIQYFMSKTAYTSKSLCTSLHWKPFVRGLPWSESNIKLHGWPTIRPKQIAMTTEKVTTQSNGIERGSIHSWWSRRVRKSSFYDVDQWSNCFCKRRIFSTVSRWKFKAGDCHKMMSSGQSYTRGRRRGC